MSTLYKFVVVDGEEIMNNEIDFRGGKGVSKRGRS